MSAALIEAAAGGATTLCRCWRVTRPDGRVLGFTDHDEPLAFGGTLYDVATGADSAIVESKLGLAVEDAEVSGALASPALTEEDIAAGRYDGAEVVLFVVDWTNPALHQRMGTYAMGEIVRADGAFRAELRGTIERLERSNARRFTRHCDAELGDSRCGAALGPARRVATALIAAKGTQLRVAVPAGAVPHAFDRGHVEWPGEGGGNGDARSAITRVRADGDAWEVRLWAVPEGTVEPGAAIRLVAGCDKTFATCRDRFGNAANFRGFPYLPDGDSAFRYATRDGVHDGAPLVG